MRAEALLHRGNQQNDQYVPKWLQQEGSQCICHCVRLLHQPVMSGCVPAGATVTATNNFDTVFNTVNTVDFHSFDPDGPDENGRIIDRAELNQRQKKRQNTPMIHLAVFVFEVSFTAKQSYYAVKHIQGGKVGLLRDTARVP